MDDSRYERAHLWRLIIVINYYCYRGMYGRLSVSGPSNTYAADSLAVVVVSRPVHDGASLPDFNNLSRDNLSLSSTRTMFTTTTTMTTCAVVKTYFTCSVVSVPARRDDDIIATVVRRYFNRACVQSDFGEGSLIYFTNPSR